MTKGKRLEPGYPDPSADEREEWGRDDSLSSWDEDVRELTRTKVPPELWGEYIERWRVEEVEFERRLLEENRLRAERHELALPVAPLDEEV